MKWVYSWSFTSMSVIFPMNDPVSAWFTGIRELRKAACASHLLLPPVSLHVILFSDWCRETSVFLFWCTLLLTSDGIMTILGSWCFCTLLSRKEAEVHLKCPFYGFESQSSENWWLWLSQLHLCMTWQLGGPVGLGAGWSSRPSGLAGIGQGLSLQMVAGMAQL